MIFGDDQPAKLAIEFLHFLGKNRWKTVEERPFRAVFQDALEYWALAPASYGICSTRSSNIFHHLYHEWPEVHPAIAEDGWSVR